MSRWLLVVVLGALALLPACRTAGEIAGLSPREQALHQLATGHPDRALPTLETLSQASPEDLDLARHLTEAYVKTGRAAELTARLAAPAPGARPEHVRHYMLGLLHFASAAEAGAPALRELEQAVALAPQSAELHFRLGLVYLEAEQFPRALPELRRALELAPTKDSYQLPLAKALARTGDPKGAIAALRKVTAGTPTPAEVKLARALMDELSDPFVRFPKAAEAKLEQGLSALRERDAPQEAIVSFEEILQDFPDLPVVHALLGLSFAKIDDLGRAVDELKRAIELAPEDGKNHVYLADLYRGRQRQQQARDEYERALALNPLLDDAYFYAGDLALEAGQLEPAKERFRTLTFLQPDAAAPRGKLALVLQMSGDWAGAERQLREVLRRAPEDVEFMLRMGMLLAEKSEKVGGPEERKATREEALSWLRKVLERQPDNALASRAVDGLKSR